MIAADGKKETGMPFKGPLVLALLDGTKTQTRRIMDPQPVFESGYDEPHQDELGIFWKSDVSLPNIEALYALCPYGKVGDRIWVREAWAQRGKWRIPDWPDADADDAYWSGTKDVIYTASEAKPATGWRGRPSIHMPRWATRILLEITSVRVERLIDISDADALAEGATGGHGVIPSYNYNATPSEHFSHIWEEINGRNSWFDNPWVWVIEFKRVAP